MGRSPNKPKTKSALEPQRKRGFWSLPPLPLRANFRGQAASSASGSNPSRNCTKRGTRAQSMPAPWKKLSKYWPVFGLPGVTTPQPKRALLPENHAILPACVSEALQPLFTSVLSKGTGRSHRANKSSTPRGTLVSITVAAQGLYDNFLFVAFGDPYPRRL